MDFYVVDLLPIRPALGSAYLVRDNWNDWYDWRTMRTLVFVDGNGRRHSMGSIKFGQRGLIEVPGQVVEPQLPQTFSALTQEFFSLGQAENFYESLDLLSSEIHDAVLVALR